MNNFLPENYEGVPQTSGNYMKLQEGDNVFRVLDHAIVGYEYWNIENKPVRSREYPKETPDIRLEKDGKPSRIKHFWAFPVWNYQESKVQILELTQASVMSAIEGFVKDEDWGDPKEYDIKIVRTGEGLETKYTVNPKPKKLALEDALEAYENTYIRLDALYDGDDPFSNENS